MKISLPFAEYTFIAEALEPLSLPAFADPLLRSVFGMVLKQLCCVAEQQSQCETCLVTSHCEYSYLLAGLNPVGSKTGIIKKSKNIPNPLLFHSLTRDYSTVIPTGSTFSCSIVLAGEANDYLTRVIQAMVQAGVPGLGRQRSSFRLVEVLQTGPAAMNRLVMANQEIIAAGQPEMPVIPPCPSVIRLTFQSPYLLPTNTDIRHGFDITRLIMQILRRISQIQESHTGVPLKTDYRHLKELAVPALIIDSDLTVETQYSYGRGRKKFTAIRGELFITLENRPELWPWIFLGQFFNVGKMASKGFGHYCLAVLN
jgi:hypothetical protein